MEDVAQEVDIGLGGLWCEEVMRLEGDLVLDLGGKSCLEGGLQRGKVLDNKL